MSRVGPARTRLIRVPPRPMPTAAGGLRGAGACLTMSTDEELRPRVSESPVLPMVGPVLYQEFLLGGRRNRQYAFRWAYAGWLVFQLLVIFVLAAFGKILVRSDESITAAASRSFTTTFVVQQFFLLL